MDEVKYNYEYDASQIIKGEDMDDLIKREWKDISQNPNYEVSNYGEIRSKKSGKILKLCINNSGYPIIKIAVGDGLWKNLTVHRLVAQAFIPNPLGKPYVNHKDYNRTNNFVENLEWITPSENNLWSREHMSEARMGKKLSDETRRKMSQCHINKSKNQHPTYIWKHSEGCWSYCVNRLGKRLVQKYFKTLEEAIAFKTKWEKEHQEVMNFTK